MLYLSPNIILVIESRKMKWAGHVARTGDRRGAYSVLVRKPEGKRPLVRTVHIWKDDIKMDLQKIVCVGIARIGVAQDRDRCADTWVCGNEPSGFMIRGNFLTSTCELRRKDFAPRS